MDERADRSRSLETWYGIAGTAFAYLIAGRLALLLAIPPGYATPVWPAAGIALVAVLLYGYRVLPGVWLGSFLVNVSTGFDASSVLTTLASLPLPTAIASGALLQAGAAAVCVRRFVGYPNPLERDGAILRFLVIGAPLGCTVSASVGVTGLLASSAISGHELAYSWLTWWAGDAIGVLLVAPPALAWLGEPDASWRPRRLALSAPLAVMLTGSVALFIQLSGSEQGRIETQLAERADAAAQLLSQEMGEHLEVVRGLKAYLEAVGEPSAEDFRAFVDDALRRHPAIQAVEWAVVVPDSRRARFERRVRRAGVADFAILEREADGSLVRARSRAGYVPVRLVEPVASNQTVLGFDLASEARRRAALERARATGRPAVTEPIRLVQDTGSASAFLVVLPVGPRESASGPERGTSVRGYAVGVFRARDLLDATAAAGASQGLGFRFQHMTAPEDTRVLAEARGRGAELAPERALTARKSFEVAGQEFAIEVIPTAAYLADAKSLQAWAVLLGMLLFVGLLSMFLVSVTAREGEIGRLVDERTVELETARRELERSNRDLEQFAYAVSHDLQAPVRTIRCYIDLTAEEAGLSGEAANLLATARGGTDTLLEMIRSLLEYARLGGVADPDATIDSNAVLTEVSERLRADLESSGGALRVQPLPLLRGDATQLAQVLQNLISNALKYRSEAAPEVTISVETGPGMATICVRDNGIGFAQKHATKIFDVFTRLHGRDKFEGTGVGLSLVRRVVEYAGGAVWAESERGAGSAFYFTWPLATRPLEKPSDTGEA